jgi:phosphatidate cytidylyltransferase
VTDRHDDQFDDDDPRASARPSTDRDRTAPEGVRIIGAEEAQAALESSAQRRGGEARPRFGDVPPRPDPSLRPSARFPHPPDEPLPEVEPRQADRSRQADATRQTEGVRQTWSASAEGSEPGDDEIEIIETDDEPVVEVDVAEPVATIDGPDDPDGPDVTDAGDPDATAPQPLPHWTEPPTGEVPVILPESESFGAADGDEVAPSVISSSTGPRFRTGVGDWVDDEYEPIEDLGDETTQVGALSTPPEEDDDDVFDREVAARRRGPASRIATRPPRPPGPTDGESETSAPDLWIRVLSGVLMAIVAIACLKAGRGWVAALATFIVGVASFEFYEGVHRRGFRPAAILGILGSVAVVPIAYYRGEFAVPFVLALVTVFTLLWYLFEVVRAKPVPNISVTIFGFVYVGVLGSFAGLMLIHSVGIDLILGVAIPVIAYDVFGYLIGSQFGKNRLAPAISPNKTVEGLVGGMVFAFLAAVIVLHLFSSPWKDLGNAAALGLTIAIVAPIGDLAESLIKRDLGIKDFGTLLPGHGGVLDRFDGILLCLPAVYYLSLALNIFHLPRL